MAIVAYTGLPGSGKSYGVVENQILPALKAGRRVVTNIPLHLDRLRQQYPAAAIDEFPVAEVAADPQKLFQVALPGCVLIIDELWRLWPAGLTANKVPEPYKTFLAEHRHMVDEAGNSTLIVFVTQDLSQIAAFARTLVSETFVATKLDHLGAPGHFQVDSYRGPVSGAKPIGAVISSNKSKYRPEIYELYQSHTRSQSTSAGANERKLDTRGVVWKQWRFLIGIPVALLLVIYGATRAWAMFHPEPEAATGASAPARPAGPSPAGLLSRRREPARVSGYMQSSDPMHSWVILEDGDRSELVRFVDACTFRDVVVIECRWDGQIVISRGPRYGNRAARVARLPRVSREPELQPSGAPEVDSVAGDAGGARGPLPAAGAL